MGVINELYAMKRSFSADRTVKHQSRSGDDQDGGAVVLDFVAQAQSAEADIIESEERAEQQENKREFATLLRAYFKKILTANEYRFLVGCIRQNKTLYQVGRALGVNANRTAEIIESKCKASEKQFFMLMSYSGYDCRRGCEFMARLFNPDAHRRKVRDKIQARREMAREYRREWKKNNPESVRASRKKYATMHPENIRASRKKYVTMHPEKVREYFQKHKQERNSYKRKYRAINPERKREEDRRYREKHREERRARDRARYAAQRERKEALKREQEQAQQCEQINA